MSSSLVNKLRIQSTHKVLILNPPEGYIVSLTCLPSNVRIHKKLGGEFDFVHAFVSNNDELKKLGPKVVESVIFDGLLWISYPKRSSKVKTDITRDTAWEIMKEFGVRPVTQISIDDTWSAMRFRPYERVGT